MKVEVTMVPCLTFASQWKLFVDASIYTVDGKAMIRNRYNRILLPFPDTIRERDKTPRRHKVKTAQAESQEVNSCPADVHKAISSKTNRKRTNNYNKQIQ